MDVQEKPAEESPQKCVPVSSGKVIELCDPEPKDTVPNNDSNSQQPSQVVFPVSVIPELSEQSGG
jgi:hypothetical protein